MTSRHLIMGTSGHVDHGKTALIRLLTGVDTDRLKEERERGISIELGFAHLDLPSGARLGIVDVPGHERFVKHMLAGAGGIDFVLLVVAADEGVMPQTVEHSQILELLGVERGIVAMTKIDMVDEELLELAEDDVREYLADTPFADWPLVRVSSVTGAGREELLAALEQIVTEVPERSASGLPRLPVDRSFIMEGFGTVVTGTLWEGAFSEGDQVEIIPAGYRARLRQVQSHGQKVKTGTAGSRLALALHGVSRTEATRGQWVVAPGSYRPASMVDVRLRTVSSESRSIKQRERVRFHLGAAEVFGRVTLFDGDELKPGETAVAQIRLEEPILAGRGDRFVVRWYSPVRTAGGGRVLEINSRKRRRSDQTAVGDLELLETGTVSERILAAIGGCPPRGLSAPEIAERAATALPDITQELDQLLERGEVMRLGKKLWIEQSWYEEIEQLLMQTATDYQQRHPLRYGVQLGELRSRFRERLAPESVDATVAVLVEANRMFVRDDRVRAGAAELELSTGDREATVRLEQILMEAGFTVPLLKTVAERLTMASDLQELLVYLVATGKIIRLTPELCYTAAQLTRMTEMVRDHFQEHPTLSVADFKQMLGVSRKYAVPLLEHLDQHGLTRRAGDDRVPGRRLADTSPPKS